MNEIEECMYCDRPADIRIITLASGLNYFFCRNCVTIEVTKQNSVSQIKAAVKGED